MCDSIANGFPRYGNQTIIVNTGNINTSNTLTLTGTAGQTSLSVSGNVFASNALVAPSVYATSIVGGSYYGTIAGSNTLSGSTQTLGGTAGVTTLNVTGNLYVSNSVTTTNLFLSGQAFTGNMCPTTDNFYSLGTASARWKDIQIGPGTIYMQDTLPPYTQAGITVAGGSFLINGAGSIQTGNVNLIDQVTSAVTQLTVKNGTLLLNGVQGLRTGNVYFTDGSIQQTAYVKPTANVLPVTPYTHQLTVDMSSSNTFIQCNVNSGQLNISIVNPTPAKEVIVAGQWGGGGSNYITFSPATPVILAHNGTNPYFVTKSACIVRVVSYDTTIANTYAIVENF